MRYRITTVELDGLTERADFPEAEEVIGHWLKLLDSAPKRRSLAWAGLFQIAAGRPRLIAQHTRPTT